jgi:hypothetical protein
LRIVNTSPLILLAGVNGLELLREPPDSDVTVPDVVFREVLAGEHFDPNVAAIRMASPRNLFSRIKAAARQLVAKLRPHPPGMIGTPPSARPRWHDLGARSLPTVVSRAPGRIVSGRLCRRCRQNRHERQDVHHCGQAEIRAQREYRHFPHRSSRVLPESRCGFHKSS